MAPLTPLAVAALGLLSERPMHPYEMYQLLVDREEDRLLKVRPGSLYHAVDRLASAAMVEPVGTERAGNRPERTRFRITDEGRRALTERLTEMLAQPAVEYPEFPLAIGEAHNLPLAEVLACVRTRIKRLTADQGRYANPAAAEHLRTLPRRFWIDVEYLQAMRQAEIDWLERLAEELSSGALSWDDRPASWDERPPGSNPRASGTPDCAADGERATVGSAAPPRAVGAAEDDGVRIPGRQRGRPAGSSPSRSSRSAAG